MASQTHPQDAPGEFAQVADLENFHIEKLENPSSDPMGVQQVSQNEPRDDKSKLYLPLEIWLQILANAGDDGLISFSRVQSWALEAVVSYLEGKLKSQKLFYGPNCPHDIFTIAVAAFPPEAFGIDLDLETARNTEPVTPTKLREEWLAVFDDKKTPVYEYLVKIIDKVLIAKNVCKYIEGMATKLGNKWEVPHRPYVNLPDPRVEEVPKLVPERSLKSMMMLWYCLIDVKKSIEEKTRQRRQCITQDLLHDAVQSFVNKVVLEDDEAALITVYRGLYFIDSMIEVVKQDQRPILRDAFEQYENQHAWASMLLYHGLDKFLDTLTNPARLDEAIQGRLPGIYPPSKEEKVDNWSTFIKDVLHSNAFDTIRNSRHAYLKASEQFD